MDAEAFEGLIDAKVRVINFTTNPTHHAARVAALEKLLMELRNVPVEPTPAMIDAAVRKAAEVGATDFVAVWKAMVEAVDIPRAHDKPQSQ